MSETIKYEHYIKRTLSNFEFVEWDRYIERSSSFGCETKVYGWIEREDDYKDFIVLKFIEHTMSVELIATSSARKEEEIHKRLTGDSIDSMKCQRVENRFDIDNSIRLDG